eukprot:1144196-Pelagomonas_calceolata.AAC.8
MAVLDVQFMELPGWSCAAPYNFVFLTTYLSFWSDQDCVRAAGVASCLIRNTGVKEIWRYYMTLYLLSDVQVMLGQTVCAAYIHMHQNHSAGNAVSLSEHVMDDGASATGDNVESAIHMTFWEWAYKASGLSKAGCMFLIIEGAYERLENRTFIRVEIQGLENGCLPARLSGALFLKTYRKCTGPSKAFQVETRNGKILGQENVSPLHHKAEEQKGLVVVWSVTGSIRSHIPNEQAGRQTAGPPGSGLTCNDSPIKSYSSTEACVWKCKTLKASIILLSVSMPELSFSSKRLEPDLRMGES